MPTLIKERAFSIYIILLVRIVPKSNLNLLLTINYTYKDNPGYPDYDFEMFNVRVNWYIHYTYEKFDLLKTLHNYWIVSVI